MSQLKIVVSSTSWLTKREIQVLKRASWGLPVSNSDVQSLVNERQMSGLYVIVDRGVSSPEPLMEYLESPLLHRDSIYQQILGGAKVESHTVIIFMGLMNRPIRVSYRVMLLRILNDWFVCTSLNHLEWDTPPS
jgi:hypothetical protein